MLSNDDNDDYHNDDDHDDHDDGSAYDHDDRFAAACLDSDHHDDDHHDDHHNDAPASDYDHHPRTGPHRVEPASSPTATLNAHH